MLSPLLKLSILPLSAEYLPLFAYLSFYSIVIYFEVKLAIPPRLFAIVVVLTALGNMDFRLLNPDRPIAVLQFELNITGWGTGI